MSAAVKIGFGILLGGILLLGACAALIAVGTSVEDQGGTDTALEDAVDAGDEPPRAPQKTRRFSGSGSKNIGTIKVTDNAVLTWKQERGQFGQGLFMVTDEEARINVSSQGKKGSSALEPGTYRNVDVTAEDDWTMTIRGR